MLAEQKKSPGKKRPRKPINVAYPIDQCALYKLRSKARLAYILGVELSKLKELIRNSGNYREFRLQQKICPFTGKISKQRWVQAPKSELKRIHERIHYLLSRISPPEYAHGAIPGRSYRTNAQAHIQSARAATFDLREFYPSTSESDVAIFFRDALQCSPDVTYLLTKLACKDGALPTGSPLSPILSLYANQSMFDRLQRLAVAYGLRFTCYIDDLTFSGSSIAISLSSKVKAIVERSGHRLAEHKTKVFGRKHAKHITGVAIKEGEIRVPHARFMKARAISQAIQSATKPNRIGLQRKLAGLLGEAAYLDSRFRGWAQKSQAELRFMISAELKENSE